MDLLEHQGKEYFSRYGLPVPAGGVADTVEEALARAAIIGYPVVLKAQVLVGGRGKAGGIKLASGDDEVRLHAGAILGSDIRGHVVRRLWVEKASAVAQEYYASFTLDRAAKLHLGMLSARGGVDIEQVADEEPGAIARVHVDPNAGLDDSRIRAWIDAAGLDEGARDGVAVLLARLWGCYTAGDADLVEVNPLVVTVDGSVLALDAKVTLDDNAAFRHPEWEEFRSVEVLDGRERLAREKGLNYIGLEGTVGIIGNGAGLVMSTLDVVSQAGGSAANFLDVGGGAGAAVIAAALEVVDSDPRVRAILVNIFGGITRCDEVARGIIDAMGRVALKAPIVVRLDGTNAAEGRMLLESHTSERLIAEPTMLAAARRAVALAHPRPERAPERRP